MRVGIIQPNFIPWRGYFDFIRSVDLFILLDDVQYSRGDWRARNRIKASSGAHWLTVPVRDVGLSMRTCDANVDHRHAWQRKHLRTWSANYDSAPYAREIRPLLDFLYGENDETLVALNHRMILAICQYLDIRTPILLASQFGVNTERTERLIELLRAVGATHYLSGSSADGYLDKRLFLENDIVLEYKSYDYDAYPQLWGEFDGAVTVLDLIANCGADARAHLASRIADRTVTCAIADEVMA